MSARRLKRGSGWRLGWDPEAETYQGLVGTDDWAIELTAAEFEEFCRLLLQLAATMAQMAAELMEGERICCETEGDRVWLEAEGFPNAYELHLLLKTGRRAEGAWPAGVVPELLAAARAPLLF